MQFIKLYNQSKIISREIKMEKELRSLGKRIAALRNMRGLTQEKLAEMVQRSPNHISKLEIAGTNPSFELLVQLARALDIELYELFNFNEYSSAEIGKIELKKLLNSSEDEKINLLYKIYLAIDG